jgi:hypothetical protein
MQLGDSRVTVCDELANVSFIQLVADVEGSRSPKQRHRIQQLCDVESYYLHTVASYTADDEDPC